jgi:hypothetical protein
VETIRGNTVTRFYYETIPSEIDGSDVNNVPFSTHNAVSKTGGSPTCASIVQIPLL